MDFDESVFVYCYNYLMRLHRMFKDRTLHIIFISAIVILSGTTVYFRFFYAPISPIDRAFLATFCNFDQELSLQKIPEEIKPGSVRVPILVYHSILPHTPT